MNNNLDKSEQLKEECRQVAQLQKLEGWALLAKWMGERIEAARDSAINAKDYSTKEYYRGYIEAYKGILSEVNYRVDKFK